MKNVTDILLTDGDEKKVIFAVKPKNSLFYAHIISNRSKIFFLIFSNREEKNENFEHQNFIFDLKLKFLLIFNELGFLSNLSLETS